MRLTGLADPGGVVEEVIGSSMMIGGLPEFPPELMKIVDANADERRAPEALTRLSFGDDAAITEASEALERRYRELGWLYQERHPVPATALFRAVIVELERLGYGQRSGYTGRLGPTKRIKMRRFLGWLLVGQLVWACGGDDAPDEEFSAHAVLGTMVRAFDSLETAGSAFGISAATGTANALDTNPLCNEKGEPVISGTTTPVDRSSPEFSAQLFYCVTSFNSLSPDTVQGTLAVMEAILCAVEEQDLLTYDGAPRSGTLDTASCFPEGLLDPGQPTTFDVTITATVVSVGGWTHQIRFQSTDLNADLTLKLLFDERFLGFSNNEGTLLLLDFAEGIARYETLFAQFGRHLRLLAEGTLATDGSFTALTRLEGAWSQGGDAASPHSIATLFGTDSGGYRTYSFNFDGAAFTEDAVNCTGTGDCSAQDGLVFSVSGDEGYLLHSTDNDVATFLSSTDPPCFASVTSGRFPDACDPRADL